MKTFKVSSRAQSTEVEVTTVRLSCPRLPEKKFSCLRRPLLIDRLDDRERLLERVGFERDGDDDDFDGLELDLESVLGFDREEDRFDDGVFDDERFSIDLLLRVGVELCVAGAFAVVRLDVERVLIFGVGRDVKDDSDGLICCWVCVPVS